MLVKGFEWLCGVASARDGSSSDGRLRPAVLGCADAGVLPLPDDLVGLKGVRSFDTDFLPLVSCSMPGQGYR